MFQKILVPLDGSKVGEAALPYIEEFIGQMAPAYPVEVTLLHVMPPLAHYVAAGETSVAVPYTESEIEPFTKRFTVILEQMADRMRNRGVAVKTIVKSGKAAMEIIKTADEIGADLIAMSTHGRSGLSRWALGSVTDKVLRTVRVPLLTVRAPEETSEG